MRLGWSMPFGLVERPVATSELTGEPSVSRTTLTSWPPPSTNSETPSPLPCEPVTIVSRGAVLDLDSHTVYSAAVGVEHVDVEFAALAAVN